MEAIQQSEEVIDNLKIKNIEFCTMWKCVYLERKYPCTKCPVLADISKMARALHVVMPEWETSFSRAA